MDENKRYAGKPRPYVRDLMVFEHQKEGSCP